MGDGKYILHYAKSSEKQEPSDEAIVIKACDNGDVEGL